MPGVDGTVREALKPPPEDEVAVVLAPQLPLIVMLWPGEKYEPYTVMVLPVCSSEMCACGLQA